MFCPNCHKRLRGTSDYCLNCLAPLRAGLPEPPRCFPNAPIAAVGAWLMVALFFTICTPLLLVFLYFASLMFVPYVIVMFWLAFRSAGLAYNECRALGGKMPLSAWCGYILLVITLLLLLGRQIYLVRAKEDNRRAIQAQYGPLYYPGAEPDREFSGNMRTLDNFGTVAKFYKTSPLCDDRKGYYGGGEYLTFCKANTNSAATRFRLTSRVDHNEPYVLIGFAP